MKLCQCFQQIQNFKILPIYQAYNITQIWPTFNFLHSYFQINLLSFHYHQLTLQWIKDLQLILVVASVMKKNMTHHSNLHQNHKPHHFFTQVGLDNIMVNEEGWEKQFSNTTRNMVHHKGRLMSYRIMAKCFQECNCMGRQKNLELFG